jgi:hypothetical protein
MVDEGKASPCDSNCRTDFQNEVDHHIEVEDSDGFERTRDFLPSASILRHIKDVVCGASKSASTPQT